MPHPRKDAIPFRRCGFQPRLADGRRLQSMAVDRAADLRLAGDGSPHPSFSTAWKTGFHYVEKWPKLASIVWKTPRNTLPLCGKPGKQERASFGWLVAWGVWRLAQ